MKKSDFVLGFFAILIVFSLVAKGIHNVVYGDTQSFLKVSGK